MALSSPSDSFPPGTTVVPFELLEGLLLVRARAFSSDSDTSGTFVLDTGAGYFALDHELAVALGLVQDADADAAVGMTRDPLRRLVLADLTMDLIQPVLTIDGDIVRRVTDRPVLGLLGSKLYQDRALQIDYPGRQLRLIPAVGTPSDAVTAPTVAGDATRPRSDEAGTAVSSAVARSRRLLGPALDAGALAVPFELAGDGKILVRARLGVSRFASSRPLTLILDTGATKTVLFRDALSDLGIGFERWPSLCGLSVPTLFGAPSACLVRMPRLNVEAFTADVGLGQVDDDARPRERKGARAPDAASSKAGGAATAANAGAPDGPAEWRMRPAVRAMLGDRASGGGSAAGTPARSAEGGAAPGGPVGASDSAATTAGTTQSPAGGSRPAPASNDRAQPLRATMLRADDLDAIVMESELQEVLSKVVNTPVHGLLGYTFLKHYKVTIDYPQRVAWFEDAADPDPRPFEYSHPGFQLERDAGQLRIVAVADGSPAARGKIVAGDTLVSVDGRDVGGQDLAEVARWLEGEPGTRVTLVIGNGGVRRTVTLTRRLLL